MARVSPSRHRGFEALEEAHVVVGHEDVHEAAQTTLIVIEAVLEPGMGSVERGEDLADGCPFDGDLGFAAREGAEGGGHVETVTLIGRASVVKQQGER